MEHKRRTIARTEWSRILESAAAYREVESSGFSATVGLLHLIKTRAMLVKSVQDMQIKIVDDDYCWLQVAPKNEHWWLTVMFDEQGKLVQYYFDVTLENDVRGADSTFVDLFLDVASQPDGTLELMDMSELEQAFNEGSITREQYELSLRTAQTLVEGIPANIRRLEEFCCRMYTILRREV